MGGGCRAGEPTLSFPSAKAYSEPPMTDYNYNQVIQATVVEALFVAPLVSYVVLLPLFAHVAFFAVTSL